MAEPHLKRRRLAALADCRPMRISDADVARILIAIRDSDADVLGSIRGATQKDVSLGIEYGLATRFAGSQRRIGLQLSSGGAYEWVIQQPGALLQSMGREAEYGNLLRATAARCNPNEQPWTLVLYVDEVTPGNVVRPDNKRKLYCFHFAFKEFLDDLRNEESWLPIAVLRHEIVKQVLGGLSCALKHVAWSFLRDGANFLDGVHVNIGDQRLQIKVRRLANLLADEDGLRACWSVKGTSGIKICFGCKNP